MPKLSEQEQAPCQTGQMLSSFLANGCKTGLTENRVFFQINTKHIHLGRKRDACEGYYKLARFCRQASFVAGDR